MVDAAELEDVAAADSGTGTGDDAVAGRCERPPAATPCAPGFRRSPARDAATAAILGCRGLAPQAERKRALPPSARLLPADASVRRARMAPLLGPDGARRGAPPRMDIGNETALSRAPASAPAGSEFAREDAENSAHNDAKNTVFYRGLVLWAQFYR